jgi:uncharacterized protein DUF433/MerR-like DNA binding protein
MQPTGAYTADRTSALSGVPKSTIHYWARTEILVPSVSLSKVKLWSHADLMGLRVIYWLRQRKTDAAGAEVPKTSMQAIRNALDRLRAFQEPLWHPEQASIWVDVEGEVLVRGPAGPETLAGQTLMSSTIDLIAPFETREGPHGPNLAIPRPELRIVPGRLSGSPHVVGTRLATRALFALRRDGLTDAAIRTLYPYLTEEQLGPHALGRSAVSDAFDPAPVRARICRVLPG